MDHNECANDSSKLNGVSSAEVHQDPPIEVALAAVPCPQCGYDLRGHPDQTRCPECGSDVLASASMARINQWADIALLDLWSICLLLAIGSITLAASLIAITHGQYVAVLLVMTSSVYLCIGLLWYGFKLVSFIGRAKTPPFQMLKIERRRKIRRWLTADFLLLVAVLLLGVLLWP